MSVITRVIVEPTF